MHVDYCIMRKLAALSFFLLLLATPCTAQKKRQARIDSLLAVLSKLKEDTIKLNVYIDIINTYNEFNHNNAKPYEAPALALARKLNLKIKEGDVQNAIGRVFWKMGSFDDARRYHNEAKQIFEAEGISSKVALSTRYIGQDYADEGNYSEALNNLTKALNIYAELGDLRRMAEIHSLIQWVYGKQGDYPNATKSGFAALALFEKIGDRRAMAIVLSDLAENYFYTGDHQAALKYLKEGLNVYRAKGDSVNAGYNYNAIGVIYRRLKDYPHALKNHQAALAIGQQVNDYNVIANAYNGIAEVYEGYHDYKQALTNHKFSAEGFKAWKNKRDLARAYCKIGECHRILKQYDLAKKYLDDAFAISKELDSKTLIADYYRAVEQLDSAKGDWQGAYVNYKKYAAAKDSIFNQENVRKVVQMDMMHEFEKKEATAKAEQEKKDLEQRVESISLGVISILIFILALVLYRNQRRMAEVNKELKHKSEKLEEENRQKNSILNIVSHDLNAPFSKIKGLADLISRTPDMTQEQKEEYVAHIQNSIKQGTSLIKNLLEVQNLDSSSLKPNIARVDVWSFVHDFQLEVSGQLLKKQQQLLADVEDEGHLLYTDPQMLTRILDNLVSNASKFSEKGKTIHLRVWSASEQILFSVRDQGPGISEEDQQKMFKKFQRLTARPTAGEGSTGLGLSITKVLVDKLNGTIDVKSKVGEGTEFIVSLPMNS